MEGLSISLLSVRGSHDVILRQLFSLSRDIPRGAKLKKHGVVKFVKGKKHLNISYFPYLCADLIS